MHQPKKKAFSCAEGSVFRPRPPREVLNLAIMVICSIAAYLLMAPFSSSCGTMISREQDNKLPRIYGGTIFDCQQFTETWGLVLMDLPFSFTVDTILLPLTIYEQFTREEGQEAKKPSLAADKPAQFPE